MATNPPHARKLSSRNAGDRSSTRPKNRAPALSPSQRGKALPTSMSRSARSPRRSVTAAQRRSSPVRSAQSPSGLSNPATTPRAIRQRLLLIWLLLASAMLLLFANLVRLQVVQAEELSAQARSQQVIPLKPFAPRRPIVDARGEVIALDRPVYILYAHPKLFKIPAQDIAAELAPIINLPVAELLKKLGEGESGLKIAVSLPENTARRVTNLGLDGLELDQSAQRIYPQESLFSEIVGYVNLDLEGQAGVEYSQQDILRKNLPQQLEIRRTGDGSILPADLPQELLGQEDLQLKLTVDGRLQRLVRTALKNQMDAFSAKRGTVIVMDVQDGAIKSLVTEPSYDPNTYYNAKIETLKNWALTDLYEPGSTFKSINVAIALEQGAIRSTDAFNDVGQIGIGQWTIQNSDYDGAGARGMQSVTEIVQHSSNIGMVRIIQQMKPEVYYRWLERIGLGKTTESDLPFETASYLKPREEFLADPVEAATAAFGQGFAITPIQMAQLQTAIANGGRLVRPHVVEGLYDSQGNLHWQPGRPSPPRLFSSKNSRDVLAMMEKAVSDGTGEAAQIPGYRIAGKTGTAQKAGPSGGYIPGARITSFVSVFPEDKPRYTVLVVVDEPEGGDAYGGTVAAPVAKQIMEALISIGQVPPSHPSEASENP